MRILQIAPYYPPAWGYGGPPRVLYVLARYLVKQGHRVTVYTSDVLDGRHRVSEPERSLDGVRVLAFPNPSNALAWRHKLFFPRGLLTRLRATAPDFDVVHISGVRSVLHIGLHRVLESRSLPYVVDAHGALPKPVGLRRLVAAVWDPLFLTPFLTDAAALLAQTRHEEALYRSYAEAGRVVRLPLPIDLSELARPAPRGLLRRRVGVDEATFLVLFLGRIEQRKGVLFLVEAFRRFLSLAPRPAHLAIVGRDSGGLEEVRARIQVLGLESHATLVGPLYDDERLAAYRDADAFAITPPYWEETSLAALEACANGTPCVITEQAEIPGLEEAGGGVSVRYGDDDAVAAAFARLAADEGRRRAMGAAAANHARQVFAVERVGGQLVEIYQRVTARLGTQV